MDNRCWETSFPLWVWWLQRSKGGSITWSMERYIGVEDTGINIIKRKMDACASIYRCVCMLRLVCTHISLLYKLRGLRSEDTGVARNNPSPSPWFLILFSNKGSRSLWRKWKWLILGLGQRMNKMSLERLIVSGIKKVLKSKTKWKNNKSVKAYQRNKVSTEKLSIGKREQFEQQQQNNVVQDYYQMIKSLSPHWCKYVTKTNK